MRKPLRDYVLARVAEPETKTAGGLYIPENASQKSETAIVEAVGKDVKDVKVKDSITYKSYGTTEFEEGKTKYILVKEEDIIATGE